MKIKTANIRIVRASGETELKEIAVKESFIYADELFFIHRSEYDKKLWAVTHFKTGMSVCDRLRTIAKAKEYFQDVMKKHKHHLTEAINGSLKKYGAANELPEDK